MFIRSSLLLCLVLGIYDGHTQGLEGLGDLANLFKMMSGEDSCELRCPSGSEPKRNPEHEPSSNGCGSMGLQFDVSEYIGFDECCNKHDLCYDKCNNNRDDCDQKFKKCLNKACDLKQVHEQLSADKRKQCNGLSELMYTGTVGLGCAAFKEAQRNACWCDGKKVSKKELERMEKMGEL